MNERIQLLACGEKKINFILQSSLGGTTGSGDYFFPVLKAYLAKKERQFNTQLPQSKKSIIK